MARQNAGAKLKLGRNGRTWYIVWTDADGRSRERSTGTPDRREAEIAFAEWLLGRGQKRGPSDPAEILITDALTTYANEHGGDVVAPRIIGCAISALSGYWHGRIIADITPLTCSAYTKWRNRSQNTVRRELAVLRAAVNWLYKNGRLTRTVAVALPAKPGGRKRWLTRQEAAKLLRASRTEKARLYMPLFILLGIYTGRRKEAILSLRWPQVDLKHGLIDFDLPGRSETRKRRGVIPLPHKLLQHLRRARERGTELGYVLHVNGASIGDIKKGFAASCRRAGLEDVTPHTLRHTAATWLMQAGVPLWEASGYLAMSEKVLTEVYGHHHPDHMRAAADALGRKSRV